MKKSLLVLSLFGAFSGVVHAQSAVVIYGGVDANVNTVSRSSAAVGKHDNDDVSETLLLCLLPECSVGDGSNPN